MSPGKPTDLLWEKARLTAIKVLTKRHPGASQEDVEDAVQNALLYIAGKDYEVTTIAGWIGLVIKTAKQRYLHIVRNDSRYRKTLLDYHREGDLEMDDPELLGLAREIEIELEGLPYTTRHVKREKFVKDNSED